MLSVSCDWSFPTVSIMNKGYWYGIKAASPALNMDVVTRRCFLFIPKNLYPRTIREAYPVRYWFDEPIELCKNARLCWIWWVSLEDGTTFKIHAIFWAGLGRRCRKNTTAFLMAICGPQTVRGSTDRHRSGYAVQKEEGSLCLSDDFTQHCQVSMHTERLH